MVRRSTFLAAFFLAILSGSSVLAIQPAVAASGPADWSLVSTGASHTCAIKPNATLWCWGSNGSGRLGLGSTTSAPDAMQVGASHWLVVSAGGLHTCAIRSDRTLWCWGENGSAQLGTGSTTDRLTPVRIGTSSSWSSISAGSAHTCAIKTDHTLWCWGSNGSGRLGDGTTTTRKSPKKITNLSTWSRVSSGAAQTCAVKTDHTLWCWGSNGSGRLGDGTTTIRKSPKKITTSKAWSQVSTSSAHTCATQTDHSLWCWGSNAYGQIGDGTTAVRTKPKRVSVTGWSGALTGVAHSCGLKTNHTLWCWGRGTSGQLGDGWSKSYSRPSQNSSATTWTQLAVGGSHSCAVQSDHSLWCWGVNSSGQLGSGDTTSLNSVHQVFSPEPALPSGLCDAQANPAAIGLASTIDGWKTTNLMAVGQQININNDGWKGPLTTLPADNQPKVIGFDFWELARAGSDRVPDLISLAQNGAILTASWHANNPWRPTEGVNEWSDSDKAHLADVANPATTAGTNFTTMWKSEVVGPLKRFQSAGVPVIVRPFHEAGQTQFWWGRPAAAADVAAHPAKYRAVFKRAQDLTAAEGVHNVLWAFAGVPQTWSGFTRALDLLPACADLGGMDTYDYEQDIDGAGPTAPEDHVTTTDYAALSAAVPRMALTEVGPFGSDGSWNPAIVTTTLKNAHLYAAYSMFWYDDSGNPGYSGKKQISSLSGGTTWLNACKATTGQRGMCSLN